MKKVKILILCGSIRAKQANQQIILELAKNSNDVESYQQNIESCHKKGQILCNSEIISGMALVGAQEAGADVRYISLMELFPAKKDFPIVTDCPENESELLGIDTLEIDSIRLQELLDALTECDGIILSTPVYFGDRSSVANKVLQFSSVRELVLKKVYGVVSVGAKRNGGQETCNIYSLYEMLGHGALGVGNGMPTSQYGGTAIGGDKGSVAADKWGLRTVFGTGERVTQVAQIISTGKDVAEREQVAPAKTVITFLIAMDTIEGLLTEHLESLSKRVMQGVVGVDIRIVNLVDKEIFRCLGCNVCPKEKGGSTAKCTIDDMLPQLVEESFNDADGFIVCGVNPHEISSLVTRYQVFTERLRCLRRNNYQLSNKLVAGLCYHEFGATINPLHSLKVMTSYVRHNTILHKPLDIFNYNGKLLDSGESDLMEFCKMATLLAQGKQDIGLPEFVYTPYGEGAGYSKV